MDSSATAEHLGEADGSGRILFRGHHAPVYYHLVATRDTAGACGVRIELCAPRDWLIDRGFDRDATLERANGETIGVRFENKLSLEDNISINLEACDGPLGSLDDLAAKYPEFRAMIDRYIDLG